MTDHVERPTDDELADRITRALSARAAAHPDPAVVAARVEALLAQQPSPVRTLTRRGTKVVAVGVVTGALAVAGAGAAAAANPYSGVARTVEEVAHAVGIEWSAMPDGYTRAQYEAFWAAYTVDDMEALSALWSTDAVETKARAGQMLLDGLTPPVAPPVAPSAGPSVGEGLATDEQQARYDAFWDAGYTADDLDALTELWRSDPSETKARAGQLLLDGQPLPVAPGSG
jgi:hypothetical protein